MTTKTPYSTLNKKDSKNLDNIIKIYQSRERSATVKDLQFNAQKNLDTANHQFLA